MHRSYLINMFRLVTFLLVVVVVCTGSPISPKILGGNDADIASYPYMLSIERFDEHLCGAVIVSANWALTDAWCTLEPVEIKEYTVRSGSAILGNGTLHNVTQWVHHPQNDVFNSEYDFALLQIDPPFEFGENVAVVALASQDQETPADAEAFLAGWGSVDDSGVWLHSQLQYMNITVYDEASCSEALGAEFQYSKLCARDLNGVATNCYHDEGGPLVVDGTAYGIALWPGYCGDPQLVQVYSRIASVRDWIDSIITE